MKTQNTATTHQVEPRSEDGGERLYNGIVLPDEWPPRNMDPGSRKPMPVPYLSHPPKIVPIDVGRQLFVDDFLIEETTLTRTFHPAKKNPGNPVLKPETPLELRAKNMCVFDDGVFFDPGDRLFKMWYVLDYDSPQHKTALAYSKDGLEWTRPTFNVLEGTNLVLPLVQKWSGRDNWSPWLDLYDSDPSRRFKAYLVSRVGSTSGEALPGHLMASPDGIHWHEAASCDVKGYDGTMLFYNPFRRRWCLSVKLYSPHWRYRGYAEHSDYLGLAREEVRGPTVNWLGATVADVPDPKIGRPTQLYNFPVVAYESIMLATPTIHYGPPNEVCREGGFPKLTQIKLAFSRDGFHFSRGDFSLFIAAGQREGDADRAYHRAAGGGCLVSGDRLLFYYCGFSGVTPDGRRDMYAGGTTHVASLRRDGFASMDAGASGGTLTTRPVEFSGKHLFVNADVPRGSLRVEVLDATNTPVEPFTRKKCNPIATDSTLEQVTWEDGSDLSMLKNKPVRFRFHLSDGSLYAFWVSRDATGRSDGYVGAGGPGYTGHVDTVGRAALKFGAS